MTLHLDFVFVCVKHAMLVEFGAQITSFILLQCKVTSESGIQEESRQAVSTPPMLNKSAKVTLERFLIKLDTHGTKEEDSRS